MDKSIVLITREGSIYGAMCLMNAFYQNLPIRMVFIQKWGIHEKVKQLTYYSKKHGLINVLLVKGMEIIDRNLLCSKMYQTHKRIEAAIDELGTPYVNIPNLNGNLTIDLLKEEDPEIIVLGGVGIISKNFIQCARGAVINAHPGIIPNYRGNFVIRWAILAGDKVGITVHLVDSGIDTGPFLSITPIELPLINSLLELELMIEQIRANLLVQNILGFVEGKILPQQPPAINYSKPLSFMHPKDLIQTYKKIFKMSTRYQ